MPQYTLDMTEDANDDLSFYRAFERKIITDDIVDQLMYEPSHETKRRRVLRDNPIAQWELKIGKFRVFYEIDGDQLVVTIISIGHKEHNVLYIRGKVMML